MDVAILFDALDGIKSNLEKLSINGETNVFYLSEAFGKINSTKETIKNAVIKEREEGDGVS